jgi:hypothetical protein
MDTWDSVMVDTLGKQAVELLRSLDVDEVTITTREKATRISVTATLQVDRVILHAHHDPEAT